MTLVTYLVHSSFLRFKFTNDLAIIFFFFEILVLHTLFLLFLVKSDFIVGRMRARIWDWQSQPRFPSLPNSLVDKFFPWVVTRSSVRKAPVRELLVLSVIVMV